MELDKQFLYRRYILENQTISQIANELGVTIHIVKSRLRRFGIRKKPFKFGDKIYDNKEWLFHQYVTLKKGYSVIANELGVSYTTILDRIIAFGWDIRGHNEIDKAAARRGLKHSIESLEKIKLSRVKNRVKENCHYCNKGFERRFSLSTRSKKSFCSNDCFRLYLKANRVVPNKVVYSAEYKEWRNLVYQRDGYRCKMPGCKSNSRKIAAHHIYPKRNYPEKQFDLSNGITLCKKCHEKTYGREEQFIEILVRVVQKMND